jgi:hypothetical protein
MTTARDVQGKTAGAARAGETGSVTTPRGRRAPERSRSRPRPGRDRGPAPRSENRPSTRSPNQGAVKRLGVAASSKLGHLWLRATLVVVSAGVVLWAISTFAGGGGQPSAVAAPPSTVGPVGFALRYLSVYLSAGHGTEQTLAPFLSTPIALPNVQPGSFKVASAEAIDVTSVGTDYWKVTVAAQVLGAPHLDANGIGIGTTTTVADSAFAPLGERCYLVAVEQRAGGYVSPVIPSGPVACPTPPPAAPITFGPPTQPDASDAVTTAVTQALSVMLTGPSDTMGRYLAPGAAISAITPPPFTSVTLTGISKAAVASASGTPEVLVFAGVEATDATGRVVETSYTLLLERPLNQWLVLKIYGAPPLSTP